MSYFTPPSNNNVSNRHGHSQAPSHSTSFSFPSSGGGYTQPPLTKKGGSIPPPVGAVYASGQTVLQCPRCREILPPGLDVATHFIGCGVTELITKAFTPFEYPPPKYNGRSGSRK